EWVDAVSGEVVADAELKARYEEKVVAHAGIRLVEPEMHGFDPGSALSFMDVHLDKDFSFSVPSMEVALTLRHESPEHTHIHQHDDGTCTVTRKKGAVVRVARALNLDRNVVAQVPAGWDAARYGVPAEFVEQVDRATLFNLVATAEAFCHAGMEPEELFAYVHPARVGSTQSSGIGGMQSLKRLYN